jgi:single-strand DNA-binding protein
MNTVQLVGVIASEIRLQEFASSSGGEAKTKASFLVAVRRPPRDSEPDWLRVETWGRQAQNLVRFNGKGSRIAIRGRLRGRFYNPDGGDRGGQLRTVVVADEIVYLQGRRAAEESSAPKGKTR